MLKDTKSTQMSKLRMQKIAKEAKGRILDIGFAAMPNEYLSGEVVGFDTERVSRPNNYSLTVVGDAKNIREILKEEKFDTVVAGEILEHLENPIKFLQDCYKLLNKNGLLIISTPNPYYPPEIIFNWFMEKKHLYCKNHLFLFPPRWMARILEYTGFNLRKTISGGIPVSQNISIPSPRFICHHMIYVAKKE